MSSDDFERGVVLIEKSGLFHYGHYRAQSKLTESSPESLIRHYLTTGAETGFDPHPLFFGSWYCQAYSIDGNPLVHYLLGGYRELAPNQLFDSEYYFSQFPGGGSGPGSMALADYSDAGWRQGRDPHPLFEVRAYLDLYPDVEEAGYDPLIHYLHNGGAEGRIACSLFDPTYYRTVYPDVASLGRDPLIHYLEHGAREGRNPSAGFDTVFYAGVAGLALDGPVNPLVHYKRYGAAAGLPTRKRILELSAQYTTPQATWHAWKEMRISDPPRLKTQVVTSVVFVFPDGMGDRWGAQVRSLSKEAPSIRFSSAGFGTLNLNGGKGRRRGGVVADRFYIFVGAGDRVEGRELLAALRQLRVRTRLASFDLFYVRDDVVSPVLLPGANRVQLKAVDACHGRFMIHGSLLGELGGGLGSPREVMLAAIGRLEATGRTRSFAHLPRFVLEAADLSGDVAEAGLGLVEQSVQTGCAEGRAGVSVVICSKEKGTLLFQLVGRLLELPKQTIREVVVVTNGPTNGFAQAYHRRLGSMDRVRVVGFDREYNFSAQCNEGAKGCSGELLLFINDDIVPIGSVWLDRLVDRLSDSRVGVAGPLLLYPDESVQHAGMFLGFNNVAGHVLRGVTLPEQDYHHQALSPRQVSSVTGAVLLTRRALFEALGGFDEQLGTYLQDIDYCLRVTGMDLDVVYEPRSVLFHCESVSTKLLLSATGIQRRREREFDHFQVRWRGVLNSDPFHHPSYALDSEALRHLR